MDANQTADQTIDPTANPVRILLVEDDGIIGLHTKSLLSAMGYRVSVCTSGEQALARLDQDRDGTDLVLMDIDMGTGLNGIDTATRILERWELPIIFVSSHTERAIVGATERITLYGYIVKGSHAVAYDASIKMALRLFAERQKTQRTEHILSYALDLMQAPVFISDTRGDVIFANSIFLGMQTNNTGRYGAKPLEIYQQEMQVYDAAGKPLPLEDWASLRGLRGETGKLVPLHVLRMDNQQLVLGYFNYGPIRDSEGRILGSYVMVSKVEREVDPAVERLIRTWAYSRLPVTDG